MKTKNRILALVQKDLLLETRQQYTLYGILLYIASTTFVVYLAMGEPDEKVWNALFWVIQLFVCVNAVAKSFLAENRGRMLYFYSITSARDFVIAKLVFNMLLMIVMSLLSLLLFTIFLGNPLENAWRFLFVTCLGGLSLSLVFTFLAAIAGKAQQSSALVAIMGFPIIIPQLLLLMKISGSSFSAVIQSGWWQMVCLLAGLDVLVVTLAIILFPFLWKD
ncbi:heme exporter protein CcmB [Sediminibacterium soli]|uniref:heme exporter protein CcmB n=1 Tax=Sediminibacterium soli TaxID=2698829 RepID=UPI00137B3250|nr:heme exporter protein CcmB [Sediminibacterium soli]NCI48148.1 cytochrome C biogenesis protein [Sediminibacterium soli]